MAFSMAGGGPSGPQINVTPLIDVLDWWNLDERLAQIYLKRVEKVAFVRADADVDFQSVATVIDVAHHAGVQRLGLLTTNQQLARD